MFYDPQTERGHYCANCLRECFGGELCQRCLDRLDDEEIELED